MSNKPTFKSVAAVILASLFLTMAGCGSDPFFIRVEFIEGVPVTGSAGTPLTLTGTVRPAYASNKDIVWSVEDAGTAGASIDGNILNADTSGTVIVKAIITNGVAEGKEYSQDFRIVFSEGAGSGGEPVSVTGVTLDHTNLTMTIGDTATLIATVTPANATNKAVTWHSNELGVATVINGVVTANAAGSAIITVTTADGGKTAECSVDVNDPSLSTLSGTITISPNSGVTVGTELTAVYSGSETVSYHWEKDGSDVGTNSNKYTPTEVGNYTVTVSRTGYNNKTSAPVVVSLSTLSGTITISPSSGVTVGTEMTAVYSGSESVTYQWQRDGTNISGATSNKYTPTEVGNYTVTVSLTGYNNKTSAPVVVSPATLSGTITISPSSGVNVNTQLTATYSGSESVTYQWQRNGTNINGATSNKYTPTEAGSYTVTVKASGYDQKTSAAVTVSLLTLSGTITINPSSGVIINTELTATYSGSESVTYQWQRNGTNISGATSNKYTPTQEGSYTVTIRASDYNPKTSAAVTVTIPSIIWAITYADGKFVAGGGSGKMATSMDGVTWTAVSYSTFGTESSGGIRAIAYGNGKFVAGGANGRMATSPDGVTWTAIPPGTDAGTSTFVGTNYIRTITYANGKFVAGSTNGRMAYSEDGVTWTAVADSTFSTSSTSHIWAITYADGKFVAGGTTGGTSGKMATSTDGVTWTAVTNSTFGTSEIRAITYGDGKFVAGGDDGKMATSTDGVTWTAVANSTFGTSAICAIAYGDGKFVASGYDGKMATSTDGVTWTAVANSTF